MPKPQLGTLATNWDDVICRKTQRPRKIGTVRVQVWTMSGPLNKGPYNYFPTDAWAALAQAKSRSITFC